MEPTDLTIEILKGIREETHKTNERLDALTTEVRTGFGEVRTEIQDLRADLGDLRNYQMATEVRLATELIDVAGAVREVRDILREDRMLRNRIDDHERRISAIEHGSG